MKFCILLLLAWNPLLMGAPTNLNEILESLIEEKLTENTSDLQNDVIIENKENTPAAVESFQDNSDDDEETKIMNILQNAISGKVDDSPEENDEGANDEDKGEDTEDHDGEEENDGESATEENNFRAGEETYESPENVDSDLEEENAEIVGQNPGDTVHDGDIMMAPGEEEAEFEMVGQTNTNIVQSKDEEILYDIAKNRKRWPNGHVPYIFDRSLGRKARSAVSAAVAEFNKKTCIKLRPRRNERNYIRIFKGKGCWSYVGMKGGRQDLSLGPGCEWKKTAIHEVMHALGFWHEQSRPDRDSYVRINWANIKDRSKFHNFNKKKKNEVTYLGHRYDYYSIMHYSRTAFGKKGRSGRLETITPKVTGVKLGQCSRCGMSSTDAKQINALYCRGKVTGGSSKVPNYSTLNGELKRMMFMHRTQSNGAFRYTLRNYLLNRYKNYWWTVSVYNKGPGNRHAFRGYCGHVFNYYKKNVVACFHKKSVSVPSKQRRNAIGQAVLRHIQNRGCSTDNLRTRAWQKANSYGVPIALTQVVRDGMGLRTAWKAYTHFYIFKCDRTNYAYFLLMFGKP